MQLSLHEISRRCNRSRDAIRRCLTGKPRAIQKKKMGRPRKLTNYEQRRLVRLASNNMVSAKELQTILGLSVTTRTLQRMLKSVSWLKYKKMKRRIGLTPLHKEQRLIWAETHVTWNENWNCVYFSDEKKFNLDGPDAWNYYWHDLRKEERYLSKRNNDRRSVMVWGAFSVNGLSELAILDGVQNSNAYMHTLERFLLPMITSNIRENFIFQQDNAAVHSSHITRSWFLFRGIKVMSWPACSPDLNPIENLWDILARQVYKYVKIYESKLELVTAIRREWQNIGQNVIHDLLRSMPQRCIEVLKQNGGNTQIWLSLI